MPREIDCPEIISKIKLAVSNGFRFKNLSYDDTRFLYEAILELEIDREAVYTESELQEAIKKEREECALICIETATVFTENTSEHNVTIGLSEAIRQRGKE